MSFDTTTTKCKKDKLLKSFVKLTMKPDCTCNLVNLVTCNIYFQTKSLCYAFKAYPIPG